MGMLQIKCDALRKSFDGVCALDGVSVDCPPNGITAIIGPNGAGKTTLLNVVTGFVRPDSGRAFLGSYELTRLAPHRVARLGVARTFQDLRLILQVSVIENVLLASPNQHAESLLGSLLRLGVRAQEARNYEVAERALDIVGLRRKANNCAVELSYGEQKLLTLACCLASGGRVLLLDEPVAGVHPEMACRIVDLLRRFRDDGKVVVFVEHDMGAVRRIADHVIVMDEGRVLAQGEPQEVLDRPEIMEAYVG